MMKCIKYAICGLVLPIALLLSTGAFAEQITVLRGDPAAAITVPAGETVVFESSSKYWELSIAKPSVADVSPTSDTLMRIRGRQPGRTTLTVLHANWDIALVEVLVQAEASVDQTNPILLPQRTSSEKLDVVDGNLSEAIGVPSGGSVVFRTDEPFTQIAVEHRQVADVATISDRDVYLLGKLEGTTIVTLIRDGQPDTLITVITLPNIAGME